MQEKRNRFFLLPPKKREWCERKKIFSEVDRREVALRYAEEKGGQIVLQLLVQCDSSVVIFFLEFLQPHDSRNVRNEKGEWYELPTQPSFEKSIRFFHVE